MANREPRGIRPESITNRRNDRPQRPYREKTPREQTAAVENRGTTNPNPTQHTDARIKHHEIKHTTLTQKHTHKHTKRSLRDLGRTMPTQISKASSIPDAPKHRYHSTSTLASTRKRPRDHTHTSLTTRQPRARTENRNKSSAKSNTTTARTTQHF